MNPPPSKSRDAFTLIELLVVMGVILLLMGIVLPAFRTIGAAGRLTAAGNRAVNLVNFARQDAMSKNAMAALILVTDPASANRNRLFTLMELVTPTDGSPPTSANWRQTIGWEVLETGVIVDQCTFDDYLTKQSLPALPALQYSGTQIADYQYAVFLPNGVLLDGNTLQVRLVEGAFLPGSTVPLYTHPATGGTTPANYYNIFVLNATGRIKIDRK